MVAALSVVLTSSLAAQPRDEVAAEALFVEGRRLMKAKQWSEAAVKFAASDQAAPSVGARLNLGDCYRELGKTASAWGAYRSAANLARRNLDARRAKVAEDRAGALEPKLSYVLIEVPEAARLGGLEVFWDGMPRNPALWGQRFPVDPGEHTVRASATGREDWKETVTVEAADALTVTVPTLAPVSDQTAEPLAPPEGESEPTDIQPRAEPGAPPADVPSRLTTGRKVAIGLAAAGVAGLAAGSIFGLSASGKWNDAKDGHCNAQLECDAEGLELADEAGIAADRATIAFVIGGAAVAGAVGLWFLAAPDASSGAMALTPTAGLDGGGLALSGTF